MRKAFRTPLGRPFGRPVGGIVAEPVFGPTSGAVSGVLGEAGVVVALALALMASDGVVMLRIAACALLCGVLVWAYLLRPRVVLRAEGVLLRNALLDTAVPYSLIDRVVIRSTTNVFVGRKKYVGLGVGRGMREMVRPPAVGPGPAASRPRTEITNRQIPDFVEDQIRERTKECAEGGPAVRRLPAWPEIIACVVLGVAVVVSFLV